MYHLITKPAAEKQIARLSAQVRRRIYDALDGLCENPRPRGCVKLKDAADLWRIRVGEYRVVYTIEDDKLIVLVVRVAHRKDVYRD
ncbi:MAG: type II toxin-antitoxin system RelE/ParE family toxin [Gemmataceae bacterium]|nr:type II toxin-antitoxin system RelE/ParE family toxin [Gemmataceae bacterium]